MKKIIVIIILLIAIVSGGFIGIQLSQSIKSSALPRKVQQVLPLSTNNTQRQQTSVPTPGIPQTLDIPRINLHAAVQSVGMDSQGRMDVPSNNYDVAWYNLGYKPGQNGSAVIDGHLDTSTGAPAVFWSVSSLQQGDKIIVTDSNGQQYTFVVDQTVKYPYNQVPLQQVFGSSDTPMLNLITCTGTWDAGNHNYSERTVVYSKLSQ